jgi:hypothetical protein
LEVEETSSVHHLKSEFFQLRGIPTDCLELCLEGRALVGVACLGMAPGVGLMRENAISSKRSSRMIGRYQVEEIIPR